MNLKLFESSKVVNSFLSLSLRSTMDCLSSGDIFSDCLSSCSTGGNTSKKGFTHKCTLVGLDFSQMGHVEVFLDRGKVFGFVFVLKVVVRVIGGIVGQKL